VGNSGRGAPFVATDSDSLRRVCRTGEAAVEDVLGNQIADWETGTGERSDHDAQATESTSLLAPAKRAALEALEREFQDLLRRT